MPQGLATSGVLANMYMFDIDAQINACVASVNGRYIRYCDDFIIIVRAKDLKTASNALALAQGVPAAELQDEKTKIHRVNDGRVEQLSLGALLAGEMEVVRTAHHAGNHVSFLGFDFDGKDVRIRQSTVGRFYSRFYRAAKSIGRLADNPDKHPSKKRVSALYEHYSPKGNRSSDKRGTSDPSHHGNYLSYVARAQKAFPNDPISGHVSKMYRKINKATGRG
ncbi:MAG: RNA-directed DNA polymerase [Collinsella aerofaciens]